MLSCIIVLGGILVATNGYETDCGLEDTKPCKISSYDDLTKINETGLDKHYVLMNDIQAPTDPPENFTPISEFAGSLNGKGHKISNLYINVTTWTDVGLFSTLRGAAVVSHLSLENATVIGVKRVGAIAGLGTAGKVKNVIIDNPTLLGGSVGGIFGEGWGDITGCHVLGGTVMGGNERGIQGTTAIGGLAGALFGGGSIRGSSADHVNVVTSDRCGGLVGSLGSAIVENSFFTGNVSFCGFGGGLIGEGGEHSRVSNSYSVCTLKGMGREAGATVGYLDSDYGASVENNFAVWENGDSSSEAISCVPYRSAGLTNRVANNHCSSRKDAASGRFFGDSEQPIIYWGFPWKFEANNYPSLKKKPMSDSGKQYCENSICLEQKRSNIKGDFNSIKMQLRGIRTLRKKYSLLNNIRVAKIHLVKRRIGVQQIDIATDKLNGFLIEMENRVSIGQLSEEVQTEVEVKINSVLNEVDQLKTECCGFA